MMKVLKSTGAKITEFYYHGVLQQGLQNPGNSQSITNYHEQRFSFVVLYKCTGLLPSIMHLPFLMRHICHPHPALLSLTLLTISE